MRVQIPTAMEIYQIAYLVYRGWTFDERDGWRKEGVLQVIDEDAPHGADPREWDLEGAYLEQLHLDDLARNGRLADEFERKGGSGGGGGV